MKAALYLLLGLLIGLSTSGTAYIVRAPTMPNDPDYVTAAQYDDPVCPVNHTSDLFGVVVIDGLSRPVYECRYDPGDVDEFIPWEEFREAEPNGTVEA